jgi:hypothetical protein
MLDNIVKGMLILQLNGATTVDAEHDQIWVHPIGPNGLPDDHAKRLKELGWFEDDELWSHYV